MTTDDSLLLSDLDRIGSVFADVLEQWDGDDRLRPDEAMVLCSVRRASREMVTLRERLERRLNGG